MQAARRRREGRRAGGHSDGWRKRRKAVSLDEREEDERGRSGCLLCLPDMTRDDDTAAAGPQ